VHFENWKEIGYAIYKWRLIEAFLVFAIYLSKKGIRHLVMANSNSITLKFSILLVLILVFGVRDVKPKLMICSHALNVTIINDIASQSTPTNLGLHCKSKDDDLGFHTLTIREKHIILLQFYMARKSRSSLYWSL